MSSRHGQKFLRQPRNPRVPRLRAASQTVASVHVGDNKRRDRASRKWAHHLGLLPGTPLVRARGQQGASVLGNEELENRVTQ